MIGHFFFLKKKLKIHVTNMEKKIKIKIYN